MTHSSLDQNIFYKFGQFQLAIYHSKRDIDVKKLKVENTFFVFSASSFVFRFIFFHDICIDVHGS